MAHRAEARLPWLPLKHVVVGSVTNGELVSPEDREPSGTDIAEVAGEHLDDAPSCRGDQLRIRAAHHADAGVADSVLSRSLIKAVVQGVVHDHAGLARPVWSYNELDERVRLVELHARRRGDIVKPLYRYCLYCHNYKPASQL